MMGHQSRVNTCLFDPHAVIGRASEDIHWRSMGRVWNKSKRGSAIRQAKESKSQGGHQF